MTDHAASPAGPPDFTPDELEAAGADGTGTDPGYTYPQDPRTLAALDHWRSLKFGVIIHWGLYALIGQDGSWSLCREGKGAFMDPPADWTGTDDEYVTYYQGLRTRFTGEDYDPAEWARACAGAGMRYLVFTSKHHDGFALYDTRFSGFKVTSAETPMRRDVLGETFDAFRAAGLETGVYFSKADWSHPGYWDLARPVTDRYHNYDLAERPEQWESFVRHTHDQIDELLTRYGDISLLWLDAGWVRAPAEPIRIDALAARARSRQPDILVVDREVHGPEENYRTPEQQIPDRALDHPWESCVTMTRTWCSTMVDEPAKPTHQVIGDLVTVVARGGNYLLGIGPDATGRMSRHIARGLAEIGAWMDVNGAAIHGTEPAEGRLACSPVPGVTWHYTRDADHLYAIGHHPGDTTLPAAPLEIRTAAPVARIGILGGPDALPFTRDGDVLHVDLPEVAVSAAFTVSLTPAHPAA